MRGWGRAAKGFPQYIANVGEGYAAPPVSCAELGEKEVQDFVRSAYANSKDAFVADLPKVVDVATG